MTRYRNARLVEIPNLSVTVTPTTYTPGGVVHVASHDGTRAWHPRLNTGGCVTISPCPDSRMGVVSIRIGNHGADIDRDTYADWSKWCHNRTDNGCRVLDLQLNGIWQCLRQSTLVVFVRVRAANNRERREQIINFCDRHTVAARTGVNEEILDGRRKARNRDVVSPPPPNTTTRLMPSLSSNSASSVLSTRIITLPYLTSIASPFIVPVAITVSPQRSASLILSLTVINTRKAFACE